MLLGGMATLVSAVLVLGDLRTKEDITARQAEDLGASLSQVMPQSYYDNELLDDTLIGEADSKKQTFIYIGRAAERPVLRQSPRKRPG